jgi:5-methyltetrahydropteroyltriglutamate--homocysteine methyltransferase
MKAYAPGIHPRSDGLIQATRDLERRRTTPEAVDEQLERDTAELVGAQQQAGLDLLSDGMLRWQDLFRPLAEASDGLTARPLTRFLDTNTFYRALIVEGEPSLREPIPAPALPEGRWLGTLPAPLALARAAQGAASAEALAANVLAPQLEAWAESGCALIILSDPFLAREGGARAAVAALAELPRDVPSVLQLPFGDASPLLEELADAPVDAIGIDFYATPIESIPEEYPREIAAGVIDSRSSVLEEPDEIAAFVEQLMQRKPGGVSLTLSGDLQFVPTPIAREKLTRLGRARAALREGVPA